MELVITNLTMKPVYVLLRNGEHVRLGPRGSSQAVHEAQVKDNPSVEKLLKQRMIAIDPISKGAAKKTSNADAGQKAEDAQPGAGKSKKP